MITGTTAVGGSANVTAPAAARQISAEDFLTLLVAQLTHQDPLQPMGSQEFMMQLAQLESVARLGEIRDHLQAADGLVNPLSALGRTVYWDDNGGELQSAQVNAVVRTGAGGFKLVVGDRQIDVSHVLRIE